jgi:hypothetical protein
MTEDDRDDLARELAVYLNITTERWRRTQYEVVDTALIEQAAVYLMRNQETAS